MPILPLHSPPSPTLEEHGQHGHLGLGLLELKEHEEGISFKSLKGGQLKVWKKAGACKT